MGSLSRDGPVVTVSNMMALSFRMITKCIADTPAFSVMTDHAPGLPAVWSSTGMVIVSCPAAVGADRAGTFMRPLRLTGAAARLDWSLARGTTCSSAFCCPWFALRK